MDMVVRQWKKWKQGSYLSGERNGTWEFWKRDGTRWKDHIYNDGSFEGKKEY